MTLPILSSRNNGKYVARFLSYSTYSCQLSSALQVYISYGAFLNPTGAGMRPLRVGRADTLVSCKGMQRRDNKLGCSDRSLVANFSSAKITPCSHVLSENWHDQYSIRCPDIFYSYPKGAEYTKLSSSPSETSHRYLYHGALPQVTWRESHAPKVRSK
jgi:hypothetical protein